jgi:hypothetical protein
MSKKKRPAVKYGGALAVPIKQRRPSLCLNDAELHEFCEREKLRIMVEALKKVDLLYRHYGIDKSFGAGRPLALVLCLARDHVPGFAAEPEWDWSTLPPGRKNQRRSREWSKNFIATIDFIRREGFDGVKSDQEACKYFARMFEPDLKGARPDSPRVKKRAHSLHNILSKARVSSKMKAAGRVH